jgi:hypothetical protein
MLSQAMGAQFHSADMTRSPMPGWRRPAGGELTMPRVDGYSSLSLFSKTANVSGIGYSPIVEFPEQLVSVF